MMLKIARKQDDLFTQLNIEFEDFEQAREFYKNDPEFRFETQAKKAEFSEEHGCTIEEVA
jgi:hypothetical protein